MQTYTKIDKKLRIKYVYYDPYQGYVEIKPSELSNENGGKT
jgi:hypothetical protein